MRLSLATLLLAGVLFACTNNITAGELPTPTAIVEVTATKEPTPGPTETPVRPPPPPVDPPPPTPTPVPPPPAKTIPEIICGVPWPCSQALVVVYGPTAACPNGESAGVPTRIGDDGQSYGLFQIYVPVHGWRVGGPAFYHTLLDPWVNVRVAYDIYLEAQRISRNGWQPWSCRP